MSQSKTSRRHLVQLAAAAAVAGPALGTAAALAAQPRMEAALAALRDARGQLDRAEHDKGGHRVKALELIDRAIEEVKEGIRVGS